MTQLGKVLKGLKCCKGLNGEETFSFSSNKNCKDCPYIEIRPSRITGCLPNYVCHHTNLMQDTIDILESYVKTDINQKQQIKAHQDWIDSWSDSNYL